MKHRILIINYLDQKKLALKLRDLKKLDKNSFQVCQQMKEIQEKL